MGLPPKNVFFKHKFRNKLEIMFKKILLIMIMNTTSSYTIFDEVASILLLYEDDFIRRVTCTRVTIG